MDPIAQQRRIGRLVDELASDPRLFGGILDGMIEKKAADETPKEVVKMAADIRKATGAGEEAALKMAWQTYVRYVNPDFAKEAKKKLPPEFLKNIKKKDKDVKKAEIEKRTKAKYGSLKTAEARTLASALKL